MKTIVKSILCLLLLHATACSRSPEEKAITAIVHHLEKTLKDPASYIPVNYSITALGKEARLQDTSAVIPATGWKIIHKFKCRSESGVVKDTQLTFFVNQVYKIENVQ